MKKPKFRQIKIKERVLYALNKKSLKELGWESGDWISQHTDTNMPYSISLFNKTLWERAAGNKPDMIDIAVDQSEKIEQDFRKIEKRYGKRSSKRKERAINKFNKGRINEEDLKKEQMRFLRTSTNSRIKDLEKTKREIKKNAKEFGSVIQNNPEEAIKRVDNLAIKRVSKVDEEIKRTKQNLKELSKTPQKRPITPKPTQKHNK